MADVEPTTSRAKILFRLKTEGPLTAADLAGMLKISVMAVHQHLRNLCTDELVCWEDRRGKVGRPSRHWDLTRASSSKFPDYHRKLAVELVAAVREVCGTDVLRDVLQVVKQGMIAGARQSVPGPGAPLNERIEALVAAREKAGYMARAVKEPDGNLKLVQHHCPILDAASGCSELCEVEAEALRDLLGEDVVIEQTEQLTTGGRSCTFRITSKQGQDQQV